MTNDALAQLQWHYDNPRAVALEKHHAGMPVVGFTSNTVPYELVRAAGFFPVLLSAPRVATPLADEFMGPIFEPRIRCIFDRVLAGDWSFLKLLIIPRTSEPEHKLFLYLREVAQQRQSQHIPTIHLYDLLHTRSPHSSDYGLARTDELAERLEEVAGHEFEDEVLEQAIKESNAARAASRQLLRLRRRTRPKLCGAEALAILSAWNFMDRTEYAELALQAVAELKRRPARTGPRIMIKGFPLNHTGLHRAIETHGATVVAEDDWHGSRSAGRDIALGNDLVACVFRKYYRDADSPSVFPPDIADAWFKREVLHDIDGVVFYLPDDDGRGRDYPRQKQFLDEQGIPNLLIREEVGTTPVFSELHVRLAAYVAAIMQTVKK